MTKLAKVVTDPIPTKPAPGKGRLLDIPARRMWGWGNEALHGYCGETSFQMAGLYFGNYLSQEQVRRADGNQELLIGENDEEAAANLSLEFETFDSQDLEAPQGPDLAEWVRGHIDQGHPVIAGFTMVPEADQEQEYDHIMPIVGYSLDDGGDVSGLYYFDLGGEQLRHLDEDDLVGETEAPENAPYEDFFNWCLNADEDLFAIAILGPEDDDEELLRTQLTISRWDEPDWGAEDKLHQKPVGLLVKATVHGLEPGTKYVVLRFDDADEVPSGEFEDCAGDADATFPFTAAAKVQTIDLGTIQSDGAHFYRTIEAGEA